MIKRIINILLTIILFVPLVVLADGGGPIFVQYDAYVNDKNGAYLYQYENGNDSVLKKTSTLLEYNTQIRVIYETEVSDGVFYAMVDYSDSEEDSEDDGYYETEDAYYINLSKISILKDELTFKDLKKDFFTSDDMNKMNFEEAQGDYSSGDSKKYIVEDTILYKGPSLKYDEKDVKAASGDIVSVKAYVDGWYYIEHANYYGWIKDNSKIAYQTVKHWFLEDTPLYDSYNFNNKLEEFIPKDTIIDKNLYLYDYETESDADRKALLLQYNGKYLWVDIENIMYADESSEKNSCYVIEDVPTYSSLRSNKSNGTIKKGTIINRTFEGWDNKNGEIENSAYYIESKKTWLKDIDDKLACIDGWDSFCYTGVTFINAKDVPLLDDIEGEQVGTLPANTITKNCYSYSKNDKEYININYKKENYWVEFNYDIFDDESDKEELTKKLEEDKYIYEKPDGNASDIKIPAGTSLWFKYTYFDNDTNSRWYYVENKKYSGWILYEKGEATEVKENLDKYEESKNKNETDTLPVINNEPDVVEITNKLSNKDNIIIGVITSFISTMFILGLILLINKNSKGKKEEIVEVKNEKVN